MRGFDALMTPEGLLIIGASVCLVLVFIVVGGFWMRAVTQDAKRRERGGRS